MVHFVNNFRLKHRDTIELISGLLLLVLFLGAPLLAAFLVGWQMALGMLIVFVIGYFRLRGRDT